MRFLVQKINKKIVHDFVFELQLAKSYYEWANRDKIILKYIEGTDFSEIRNPDLYIPIGSVEFVSAYLMKFYPNAKDSLLPINVPECLFKYAGRKIANITDSGQLIGFNKDVFVKSNRKIKDETNGVAEITDGSDYTGYQVSELIDILSEWRVFVFHNQIQFIANYSGDCTVFPDANVIRQMIDEYKDSPRAYTIDVAVKDGEKQETVVMECHRFFSCGLYGYSDHGRIPIMFSQEWFEMKNLAIK